MEFVSWSKFVLEYIIYNYSYYLNFSDVNFQKVKSPTQTHSQS